MTTISEVTRALAEKLKAGKCEHGAHPLYVQTALSFECLEMSVGELLAKTALGERMRCAMLLYSAACPKAKTPSRIVSNGQPQTAQSFCPESEQCNACDLARVMLGVVGVPASGLPTG